MSTQNSTLNEPPRADLMPQISLFEFIPDVKKRVYLDLFGMSYYDNKTKKIRLCTLKNWENTPQDINISIAQKTLLTYPIGTIFKMDAKLIKHKTGKHYLSALKRKTILPAIEFFTHNINLK
jgi:hypothetical protein